ncbi:MAG: hypothetical protein N2689_17680, partial [Verrucomicrobiae bacterium]|nr:hypothetical protein [Verrucomicrobiae bacterium]
LKWDGINLWIQLTGQAPPKSRVIYGVGPGGRTRMVRDGDWKLIVKQDKAELFDLARDTNETTDLAAKEPDKVAALRTKLADLARADNDALAEPRAAKKAAKSE